MKQRDYVVMGVAISLLLSVAITSSLTSADDPKPPTDISVNDIGGKIRLIGRLGEPLGKMMTVTGTWAYPSTPPGVLSKDGSLRFTVSHVNDKQLIKGITFNISQVSAVTKDGKNAMPKPEDERSLDGLSWTLRAYETGRHNIEQKAFWTDGGSKVWPLAPYWEKPFTSELVVVIPKK